MEYNDVIPYVIHWKLEENSKVDDYLLKLTIIIKPMTNSKMKVFLQCSEVNKEICYYYFNSLVWKL